MKGGHQVKAFHTAIASATVIHFGIALASASDGSRFISYTPAGIGTCAGVIQAIADERVARSQISNPEPNVLYNSNYARLSTWTQGFISGVNLAAPNGKANVLSSIETSAVHGFILLVEKRCKEFPTEKFINAVGNSLVVLSSQ
jgi:hypothetical protein